MTATQLLQPLIDNAKRPYVLTLTLIAYAIACFYPFEFSNPTTPNALTKLADGELQFREQSIAYNQAPLDWQNNFNRLVIDMEFTPQNLQQQGPARILSLSKDITQRNLTVGQVGTALDLRLRHPGSNDNGTPGFRIPDVLTTSRLALHIDWSGAGLKIVTNGETKFNQASPTPTDAQWDSSMPLILGNELSLDRQWQGTLHRLQIKADDKTVFDLKFDAIARSWAWQPDHELSYAKEYLLPFQHATLDKRGLLDMIYNALGFIPFALVICWRKSQIPSLLAVIGACAVLSASIETIQLVFAGRHTSGTDLFLNSLSGGLGWWIARRQAWYKTTATHPGQNHN